MYSALLDCCTETGTSAVLTPKKPGEKKEKDGNTM
jgi:hypothetical protein